MIKLVNSILEQAALSVPAESREAWIGLTKLIYAEAIHFGLWLDTLPRAASAGALLLIECGGAELSRVTTDEPITKDSYRIHLNMNDTFSLGSAEAVAVPRCDLPAVACLFDSFGQCGLTAWASRLQNVLPLEAHRTKAFWSACEELNWKGPANDDAEKLCAAGGQPLASNQQ